MLAAVVQAWVLVLIVALSVPHALILVLVLVVPYTLTLPLLLRYLRRDIDRRTVGANAAEDAFGRPR